MKLLWIAFLACYLVAGDLLEKVEKIVGKERFSANQKIIHTLFSKRAKYYTDGRIDFAKVCRVLERTALLPKEFPAPKEQSLTFVSEDRVVLAMKVVDEALKSAGLFEAMPTHIERKERFEERFSLLSAKALRLSRLVAALESLGARVVDLANEDGWRFYLDMDFAKLPAKRVSLPKRFESIQSPLWLDVCGLRNIRIRALSRWWYPDIYIYDASLDPLDVITRPRTKDLMLSLPKGSCYIKIADRFTIQNIKRGFMIEGF